MHKEMSLERVINCPFKPGIADNRHQSQSICNAKQATEEKEDEMSFEQGRIHVKEIFLCAHKLSDYYPLWRIFLRSVPLHSSLKSYR